GSWGSVVEDLKSRGLADPLLVVCDGNAGLIGSIRNLWPRADVQRCLKHKLDNLLAHAPRHAHAELKRDFREIHFGKTPGE
ncbi:IS256 family transposase, partial [Enterococcus hirae]